MFVPSDLWLQAMMSLYAKQDGIGFSRSEFPIMAEIVAYYRNKGTVTPSMMRTIKRTVRRYLPLLTLEAPRPKRRAKTNTQSNNPVILEQINTTKRLKLSCDESFTPHLKKVYGRMYVPKKGYWSLPMSLKNIQHLTKAGAELGPRLRNWYENITTQPDENLPLHFNALQRELRPYQEYGVRFIEAKNGRCLIADDMGLGKTTEILAWLDTRPDAWPVLIVCPSSVKYNWGREIQKCLGKVRVQFLAGKKPVTKITGKAVIINYDILMGWKKVLADHKFKTIVFDEGHYLKNTDAKRTKAAFYLSGKSKHILWATGTPIEQKPIEFWTALNVLAPGLFYDKKDFGLEYCGAKKGVYGWEYNGATNTKELHKLLTSTIMLRRKKTEVAKEIPEKNHIVVPIEMDRASALEYRRAESQFLSWLRGERGVEAYNKAKKAEQIVKINHLKQLAWRGKAEACVKWVQDFLESGNKLVTFHAYTESLEQMRDAFIDTSVVIRGGMKAQDKLNAIDMFVDKDYIRLCHCNIIAGGTGTDGLQHAASDVAFYGPMWNPMIHVQAEDRLHRIGQTLPLTVWWFVSVDTVEEDILNVLDVKKQNVSACTDGEDIPDKELLTEILKRMNKRHVPEDQDG